MYQEISRGQAPVFLLPFYIIICCNLVLKRFCQIGRLAGETFKLVPSCAMCTHCVGTETAEMCRKELRFYCGGVAQCSCYSNLTNQGHLVRENKCRKMKTYKNTKIVLSHQSYQSHLAAYLCQVIIPYSTQMLKESSFIMTIINKNITFPL